MKKSYFALLLVATITIFIQTNPASAQGDDQLICEPIFLENGEIRASTNCVPLDTARISSNSDSDSISTNDSDTSPELGSPRENICNPDGIMDQPDGNVCTTEWHWRCGWFMALFYFNDATSYFSGGYDTSLVPVECHSLLPPPHPVSAASAAPVGEGAGGAGVVEICVASVDTFTRCFSTDGTGFAFTTIGGAPWGEYRWIPFGDTCPALPNFSGQQDFFGHNLANGFTVANQLVFGNTANGDHTVCFYPLP